MAGKRFLIAPASCAAPLSGAKYTLERSSPVVTLRRFSAREVRPAPASACGSLSRERLAEVGIGDYQRLALTFPGHLHPQKIAPAGQIADGVALQQISPLLVDQRFDGNQIEGAIGRNQQLRGIADEGAERLHHHLIEAAVEAAARPSRDRGGLAKGSGRAVDFLDRAEIFPERLPWRRSTKSRIAGSAIGRLPHFALGGRRDGKRRTRRERLPAGIAARTRLASPAFAIGRGIPHHARRLRPRGSPVPPVWP